MSQVGLTSIAG